MLLISMMRKQDRQSVISAASARSILQNVRGARLPSFVAAALRRTTRRSRKPTQRSPILPTNNPRSEISVSANAQQTNGWRAWYWAAVIVANGLLPSLSSAEVVTHDPIEENFSPQTAVDRFHNYYKQQQFGPALRGIRYRILN